jgi:hypothetical protein
MNTKKLERALMRIDAGELSGREALLESVRVGTPEICACITELAAKIETASVTELIEVCTIVLTLATVLRRIATKEETDS